MASFVGGNRCYEADPYDDRGPTPILKRTLVNRPPGLARRHPAYIPQSWHRWGNTSREGLTGRSVPACNPSTPFRLSAPPTGPAGNVRFGAAFAASRITGMGAEQSLLHQCPGSCRVRRRAGAPTAHNAPTTSAPCLRHSQLVTAKPA